MPAQFRLAIVGTENSHAEEIVRVLNVERERSDARVVALVGDDDRTRELADDGGVEVVVPRATDLLGAIDALVVTNRDGADHRALAVPFLEAGTPVWVDKPLAANVSDARAILDAASEQGVPVTSYSAVRWVPDADAIVEGSRSIGDVQAVTVSGPADAASPYSGIFFYGIHCADLAQRLAPGMPEQISVERVDATVTVRYLAAGVPVTLHLVEPTDVGRTPFRATVLGREGAVSKEIHLGHDYVEPGIDRFLELLRTGQAPLDAETMLAPIVLLEDVAAALRVHANNFTHAQA